ncbi:PTS fructose transporter subunit IIB [Listeria monocytogenes]|nr:PTS fructose transporter subunit IIB [Listeria monocytogenes]
MVCNFLISASDFFIISETLILTTFFPLNRWLSLISTSFVIMTQSASSISFAVNLFSMPEEPCVSTLIVTPSFFCGEFE